MTRPPFTPPSPAAVTSALLDLRRAAAGEGAPWALVGGQALRAHGVPRETLDADAIVEAEALVAVAEALVAGFAWSPLVYDDASGDYAVADGVTIHEMDDPVLFDVGVRRRMIPLASPLGLPVELLAAQCPVEEDMVALAAFRLLAEVSVPVAPLGGVLLVKAKADRPKDVAALEQAAEHLPAAHLADAVEWARRRDPATADDLAAALAAARARRAPVRTVRPSRTPRGSR